MQKSSLLQGNQIEGFHVQFYHVERSQNPSLAWNPYIHCKKGSHTRPIISTLGHVECKRDLQSWPQQNYSSLFSITGPKALACAECILWFGPQCPCSCGMSKGFLTKWYNVFPNYRASFNQ